MKWNLVAVWVLNLVSFVALLVFYPQSAVPIGIGLLTVSATLLAAASVPDELEQKYNPLLWREIPPEEWPIRVGILWKRVMGERVEYRRKNIAPSRIRPRQYRARASAGYHYVEVEFAEYLGKYRAPRRW